MIDLENQKEYIKFFEINKILSINDIKVHITHCNLDKYVTQKQHIQMNKIKN